MRLILQLGITAALLITFTSATPYSKRDRFTVQQTRTKSFRKSGPVALARVYRKFGQKLPGHIADDASNATDSVTATPSDTDSEYTAVVNIGGQDFNLDFDTGSSDLWVYSTELSKSDQGNHSIYDPTTSSTSKQLEGSTWEISYGDGSSASGDVYSDIVDIGGVTVKTQAVELASTVSKDFLQDFNNDGLLGLAFDNINNVKPQSQKTFFTNVRNSLASPLFTADLRHAEPGSYDFGFIDSTKYTGDIVYLEVNNTQGFWTVTSSGYSVGGDGKQLTDSKMDGIVDTGTTLLLVSQDVVKAYYDKIDGARNDKKVGGYTFPCSAQVPDFYLGFGAYTAQITGQIINLGPVDPNQTSTCFGGIQPSPPSSSDAPAAIFGDIFMKSTFVVFKAPEGETPSVGFAAKAKGLKAGLEAM